jgi:hypothetical protein
MNCGGYRRLFRHLAIISTTFVITWGNALAAPPQEPPGQSGQAPGQSEQAPGQHRHESTQPGPPESAPGQQKKTDFATTPEISRTSAHRNAERPAKQKKSVQAKKAVVAESTRYTNPQGKPKRNVPAVAETAPAASASGPGKSGIHKLTLCHKGHAITVDIHAAAAHMRHGDTFLPAGTKGRAACGTRKSDANVHSRSDVAHTAARSVSRSNASDTVSYKRDATTAADDATADAKPKHGVLGRDAVIVDTEDRAALDVIGSSADELPFTGWTPARLVLTGLLLIALGSVFALSRGSSARRAAARVRTSRLRRARS